MRIKPLKWSRLQDTPAGLEAGVKDCTYHIRRWCADGWRLYVMTADRCGWYVLGSCTDKKPLKQIATTHWKQWVREKIKDYVE